MVPGARNLFGGKTIRLRFRLMERWLHLVWAHPMLRQERFWNKFAAWKQSAFSRTILLSPVALRSTEGKPKRRERSRSKIHLKARPDEADFDHSGGLAGRWLFFHHRRARDWLRSESGQKDSEERFLGSFSRNEPWPDCAPGLSSAGEPLLQILGHRVN